MSSWTVEDTVIFFRNELLYYFTHSREGTAYNLMSLSRRDCVTEKKKVLIENASADSKI